MRKNIYWTNKKPPTRVHGQTLSTSEIKNIHKHQTVGHNFEVDNVEILGQENKLTAQLPFVMTAIKK